MKLKDKITQLKVSSINVPYTDITVIVAHAQDSQYVSVKHVTGQKNRELLNKINKLSQEARGEYAGHLIENGHIEPEINIEDCPYRSNYTQKPVLLIVNDGRAYETVINTIIPAQTDLRGTTDYWAVARTIKQNALVGKNIFVYSVALGRLVTKGGIVFTRNAPILTCFNAEQMSQDVNITGLALAAFVLNTVGKSARDYAVVFCTIEQFASIECCKKDQLTTIVNIGDVCSYMEEHYINKDVNTAHQKSLDLVNKLVFKN